MTTWGESLHSTYNKLQGPEIWVYPMTRGTRLADFAFDPKPLSLRDLDEKTRRAVASQLPDMEKRRRAINVVMFYPKNLLAVVSNALWYPDVGWEAGWDLSTAMDQIVDLSEISVMDPSPTFEMWARIHGGEPVSSIVEQVKMVLVTRGIPRCGRARGTKRGEREEEEEEEEKGEPPVKRGCP